ncbi:MAG: 23S rRNA (pseudouridine(1915)-N(3))-methyltransferase RlmH [Patescibacteria group bacterium]|nr:23S rRNA (pseudouridine(1915)-N(3))-methyltransferase RlmH [Patescibacteria group bacterium]
MKLHIVTIGEPKLGYAKEGWAEYWKRLGHYHQLRVTHIADKNNDAEHILAALEGSYAVGLVIEGQQLSSPELAIFLDKRALEGREISFVIGGPDGLPPNVIEKLHFQWSFGKLTLPHDLAMVVLLETLYRASTISAGQPYHR